MDARDDPAGRLPWSVRPCVRWRSGSSRRLRHRLERGRDGVVSRYLSGKGSDDNACTVSAPCLLRRHCPLSPTRGKCGSRLGELQHRALGGNETVFTRENNTLGYFANRISAGHALTLLAAF